ncbi:hypothetical protein DFS34DRAFT_313179 [Phlyctochytrium arcticum]|nr:hypothetical protein DFS34DRAFT_313179 [Phlyctochytrium arcticum]
MNPAPGGAGPDREEGELEDGELSDDVVEGDSVAQHEHGSYAGEQQGPGKRGFVNMNDDAGINGQKRARVNEHMKNEDDPLHRLQNLFGTSISNPSLFTEKAAAPIPTLDPRNPPQPAPPTMEEMARRHAAQREKFHAQKAKKVACEYWPMGRCYQGDKCQFSHAGEGKPYLPSERMPCRFFKSGQCIRGSECPWSHNLKLEPCVYHHARGGCIKGASCLFSHDHLTEDQVIRLVHEEARYVDRVTKQEERQEPGMRDRQPIDWMSIYLKSMGIRTPAEGGTIDQTKLDVPDTGAGGEGSSGEAKAAGADIPSTTIPPQSAANGPSGAASQATSPEEGADEFHLEDVDIDLLWGIPGASQALAELGIELGEPEPEVSHFQEPQYLPPRPPSYGHGGDRGRGRGWGRGRGRGRGDWGRGRGRGN